MGYVPCCVPNCDDRKSTRHRFPNPTKDEKRYKEWIKLIANPKLFNIEPAKIYSNYRVCHQHFLADDNTTNMYIKRIAVPSRKLIVSSLEHELQRVPLQSTNDAPSRKGKLDLNTVYKVYEAL